jgi:hypothetical protein
MMFVKSGSAVVGGGFGETAEGGVVASVDPSWPVWDESTGVSSLANVGVDNAHRP